jgi:hypothetical protein
MGSIKILSINRNLGAISQQYRIELRKQGDVTWTAGPTLSYDQAVSSMPLLIPISDTWLGFNVEVRVVTICGPGIEVLGTPTVIPVPASTSDVVGEDGIMTIQHIATAETVVTSIDQSFMSLDTEGMGMYGGDPDRVGTKNAFTGNITINIGIGPCNLQIFKNGSLISTTLLNPGANTIAINVNATDDLLFRFTDTTTPPPSTFAAFWGVKDTAGALSEATIEAGSSGTFTNNAQVDANFTSNILPKYLWVAIPVAQPLKTKWYVSVLNNGNIGTPDDLFDAPVTVGAYRFYITNYPTAITEAVTQFRNS